MKVLHITTGYPISYQGGITNYVRSIATEQVNKGMDVSVIGGIDKNKEFNFKYYEYYSNNIKPFKFKKADDINSLNKIKKILEDNNFDLIHIHMMLDIDWRIVDLLKNKYKYIISLHDYFYICPRTILMNWENVLCKNYNKDNCRYCVSKLETVNFFLRATNFLNKKMNCNYTLPRIKQNITDYRFEKMKELLESASLLLPVSKRVEELYKEAGINGKYRMLHIGNYSAESYKKFNLEKYEYKNEIDVVMLGSLTYHKGASLLLNILKELKNEKINIHFYGRIDKKYERDFNNSKLIYHGKYNQKELGNILNNMDLGLVLPIWEDNAPQVVMELLNNNVPIIATRMGGIPDFINSNNGYLFNAYSKVEMNKMLNFLNNITIDQIIRMKQSITRTKTVFEHIEELNHIYNNIK